MLNFSMVENFFGEIGVKFRNSSYSSRKVVSATGISWSDIFIVWQWW